MNLRGVALFFLGIHSPNLLERGRPSTFNRDVDNTKNKLNCLSLCAGYGGLELGLREAGVEFGRVVYVEREAFAAANLVSKIEEGKLAPGVVHSDVKTFPYERFRDCFDCIIGGFPCQPFSQGNAAGRTTDTDPRHLFPYIKHAIRTVRPRWVFLENVEGIVSSRLQSDNWADPEGTPVLLHVLRELERVGLEATAGLFSAASAGASQERRRIFILATAGVQGASGVPDYWFRPWREEIGNHSPNQDVANTKSLATQGADNENKRREAPKDGLQGKLGGGNLPDGTFPSYPGETPRAGEEPRVHKRELDGAVNGTSGGVDATTSRVERLTLIGNGVCPATAAQAFRVLSKELNR